MTGGAQDSGVLLPCPFCGGVGDIESQPSYSQAANTYDRYRGWCDQCGFGLDWHGHEADAIAAWNRRATPAPAGWQEGNGWVFWNPDSGEEYAPNHPVESGECTDAESVRKSTPQEDTLYLAFQNEFARAEHLTNILREIEASASTAIAGSRTFTTAPAEGGV